MCDELFDIMRYGSRLEPQGLMTKNEAEDFTKALSVDDYVIGWTQGTCQSRFQFWTGAEGLAIELPHASERPTGRAAAIMVMKAKKGM
jgi:hypothetical protein